MNGSGSVDNISDKKVSADEYGELSFEQAIARLEEIVRALESGSAPLDRSLTLFEEGVRLVKLCNERLDNAEARVKIVTASPDGGAVEENFKR